MEQIEVDLRPDVGQGDFIAMAHAQLMAEQMDQSHWNFYAHLGPHFISQYYLVSKWLELKHTQLDVEYHKNLLLSLQLPDGSWHQVVDRAIGCGDINATIFNYWALKAMGEDTQSEPMRRARAFILSQGGIAKSALFAKVFLALFGNYPWKALPYVPYIVFLEQLPQFNYKQFSQWVIPHLMPIAYLRHTRANRDLGFRFALPELWVGQPPQISRKQTKPRLYYDWPLVEKILAWQQPRGSWGGYTVSSLLSMMVLAHARPYFSFRDAKMGRAFERAQDFVEWLYFDLGEGSYSGALMDGHYWDTLLTANGLIETGYPLERLEATADYILATQQRSGGFPYGIDFEYAPDVDDTAEAVLFLSHWEKHREPCERAASWLRSMQNRDGGWGAFDQDNVGNIILRQMARGYSDSVDLFDDSSADSTGHVLDALSQMGDNRENSKIVRQAIAYLKRTQNSRGAWEGRWAINYLFGTCCALVGLLKVGERPDEAYIRKSFAWLLSKQNTDGGFGESTLSYLDEGKAGVGESTPSQTAWVLWALSHGGYGTHPAADCAAAYLQNNFLVKGRWHDDSVTGTGHPGLLYMNYPSYAKVFPLIALGHYRRNSRRPSSVV